MDKRAHEAFANVIGGLAMSLAVLVAGVHLMRTHYGIWVLPLVALILWREVVFMGIRVELDHLRKVNLGYAFGQPNNKLGIPIRLPVCPAISCRA